MIPSTDTVVALMLIGLTMLGTVWLVCLGWLIGGVIWKEKAGQSFHPDRPKHTL